MRMQPLWKSCRTALVAASVCGGILASCVQPAAAATATGTLTITVTVISACVVSNGTVAFPNYSPIDSVNVDQTGTFTVTCTKGTPGTLGLGLGANTSGGARRMANGTGEFLVYELYKEAAHTNVWGNSAPAWVTLANAPSNLPQTQTVYGRIAPGQNVLAGSYSDTVTITLTY